MKNLIQILLILLIAFSNAAISQDFIKNFPGIPIISIAPYDIGTSQYDKMKEMGIDFIITDNLTQTQLNYIKTQGLKVIPSQRDEQIDNYIMAYSEGAYTKWEAEGTPTGKGDAELKYKSTIGSYFNSGGRQGVVTKIGAGSDTLIYGPGYMQERRYWRIDTGYVQYNADFNMKLSNISSGGSPNDTICILQVTDSKIVCCPYKDSTIFVESRALLRNNFTLGTWQTFQINYDFSIEEMDEEGELPNYTYQRVQNDPPNKNLADYVQFKVIWKGDPYTRLYVDNVIIYDQKGWNIVNNEITQGLIETQASQSFASSDIENYVAAWNTIDEPETIDNYEPIRKIDSLLKAGSQGKRGIWVSFPSSWNGRYGDSYLGAQGLYKSNEFVQRTGISPHQNNHPLYHYPLTEENNPFGGDYKVRNIEFLGDSIMNRVNDWDSLFSMTLLCGRYDAAFLFHDPLPHEMLYEANLKLMYGAKSLSLYRYYASGTNPGFTGLVIPLGGGNYTYTSKWSMVKNTLSPRLKGWFGKTIRYITQESQHLGISFNTRYNFIENIVYSSCPPPDATPERYDLGFFEKNGKDYFMIINGWYNTYLCPLLIKINDIGISFNNYRITNYIDSTITTIPNHGIITFNVNPGDARLYEVVPVVKYGGTLLYSETIPSGSNFQLEENLVVAAGVTLTIQSGATLTFKNNSSLVVNGNLVVNGTTNSKVTFDFLVRNATVQNGIKFNQGSSANISNAIIKNAENGIYSYKVYPAISDCEIFNCNRGIYLYNLNSVLDNGSSIQNNNIHNNSTGIYLYASSPDIRNNEIYNSYYGIYANLNSSPKLGEYVQYGNNYIHNNFYGIYASQSSNPFLGEDECVINGGNNQVTSSTFYHIYTNTNCIITAEKNWWGSNPPQLSKFHQGSGSTIDYTPYLTSPPSDGFAGGPEEEDFDEAFGNGEKITSNTDLLIITFNPNWPIGRKLRFARSLVYLGRNGFAQQISKQVITENPDSVLSFFALDILLEAARNIDEGSGIGLNALRVYLANLIQNGYPNRLIGAAGLSLAGMQSNGGLNIINQIINHFPGTHIGEAALFKKFMYYLFEESNRELAIEVMEEIDQSYPNSESSIEAHRFIEGVGSLPKFAGEENNKFNIPDKYELLGNYPNPFNPSTIINYNLPFQSEIELVIYDIIGREVRAFKNLIQSAGSQNLLWDGRNNYGETLASGIYLYRIKAKSLEGNNEEFEKSAKLILLK